jgi:hypothetical protein
MTMTMNSRKNYTKNDALNILKKMRNYDTYEDLDFDWFMNDKLYSKDEVAAEWALKANPVEIVEEFIKRYYL